MTRAIDPSELAAGDRRLKQLRELNDLAGDISAFTGVRLRVDLYADSRKRGLFAVVNTSGTGWIDSRPQPFAATDDRLRFAYQLQQARSALSPRTAVSS